MQKQKAFLVMFMTNLWSIWCKYLLYFLVHQRVITHLCIRANGIPLIIEKRKITQSYTKIYVLIDKNVIWLSKWAGLNPSFALINVYEKKFAEGNENFLKKKQNQRFLKCNCVWMCNIIKFIYQANEKISN